MPGGTSSEWSLTAIPVGAHSARLRWAARTIAGAALPNAMVRIASKVLRSTVVSPTCSEVPARRSVRSTAASGSTSRNAASSSVSSSRRRSGSGSSMEASKRVGAALMAARARR